MTAHAPGGGSLTVKANELYVDGSYTGSQENGSPDAPYTTIAAAIAAAAANDVIMIAPGAYTEDLTLADGVNLHGHQPGTVTVTGTATATDVTLRIENLDFTDDGAGNALYFTGTAADALDLSRCTLTGTATGGSALEMDNTAGSVVAERCNFVMTTGNAAEVIRCEQGTLTLKECSVDHQDNTSESLVAEGDAATTIECRDCTFTGSVASEAAAANPTMAFVDCAVIVGAVSAVIVAAANTVVLNNCQLTSTDAANDAIDGAGTVNIQDLAFLSTADEIAATVTVTHLAGSWIQHGDYTEAAGAGVRAITLPQPFPSTSYNVFVTYEDTGTGAQASSNEIDTIAATGFNLTTQGNGVYHWFAIHD